MATLEKLRKSKQIIRAAVYMRFSSDNQREESIEAQLRAIKDYADKNDIIIVSEYADRAKSATTDNRPEFLHMIDDSKKGLFDVVLVHKLDRFARNRADSIGYRTELKRNGVSLISILEYLDEDSLESLILESVLEAMAEYYSKNLAREVNKGLKENALKGLHTGGKPALGYDVDPKTKKLILNEDEAVIVKLIFQRTIEGYGYSDIIDELNNKGFKSKRGSYFSKNSLGSILQNEKYTGVYIFNKSASKDVDGKRNGHKFKEADEIIRIDDAVPQIISKEDFAKVQEKLSKRKQTRKSSRAIENYLLTSKTVCGVCGGAYVGTRRSRSDKSGLYWIAYGCNKRHRNHHIECHNKEISKPYIEGCILEKLADYVFNDSYIPIITKEYNKYLQGKNSEYVQQVKNHQTQLKQINSDIDKLVDLLMQTSSQTLLDKLNGMEKQKLKIEAKLNTLTKENRKDRFTPNDIKVVFEKIRGSLLSGSLINVKQVIETNVDKIVVYPDKVEVKLNFFPDFSLKIQEKEKNRPMTECVEDIQEQFISENISKNADDIGGERENIINTQP